MLRPLYIYLCFCFAAIAFLMVLLMRFLAAIIVWLIVILAAVGSLGKWHYQIYYQDGELYYSVLPVIVLGFFVYF
jgi:hypothetical protein